MDIQWRHISQQQQQLVRWWQTFVSHGSTDKSLAQMILSVIDVWYLTDCLRGLSIFHTLTGFVIIFGFYRPIVLIFNVRYYTFRRKYNALRTCRLLSFHRDNHYKTFKVDIILYAVSNSLCILTFSSLNGCVNVLKIKTIIAFLNTHRLYISCTMVWIAVAADI